MAKKKSDIKDEFNISYGMGWIPDYPDMRDFTPDHELVVPMLNKIGILNNSPKLSSSADLRQWCTPVKAQGGLGACTAHAAAGLVEYFENRAVGKYLDGSRLFLYKVARNLLGWTGDTGAYCRSILGALVLFGIPPEKYWSYDVSKYEEEPTAFCYSLAQNYQTTKYFRLDTPDLTSADLLSRLKEYLSNGIPFLFGFTVYSSYKQGASTGKIPYPGSSESVVGTHCVMAVGYDDSMAFANKNTGITTTGALLIKNSWGSDWGMDGYGWIPYDYVLNGIAQDCWCILNNEWIELGEFI